MDMQSQQMGQKNPIPLVLIQLPLWTGGAEAATVNVCRRNLRQLMLQLGHQFALARPTVFSKCPAVLHFIPYPSQ